jgi:hypothetical protein
MRAGEAEKEEAEKARRWGTGEGAWKAEQEPTKSATVANRRDDMLDCCSRIAGTKGAQELGGRDFAEVFNLSTFVDHLLIMRNVVMWRCSDV